ncbi:MAG TPA: opioid growth factor receptor-related protein [Gemmataceae bacterium]|nr:opioid growth factor receptor-related protein [Gemmataceae bacterium]
MAVSPIAEFYALRAPDYRGRWLKDMWAWDLDTLEDRHDYIQVMFPNAQPSGVNPHAPLLDRATIDAFLADEALRANLARSHDLMLRFYGLEYDPAANEVRRRPDFAERAANWLTPHNHNYLRITRILTCLRDLGLRDRVAAMLRALEAIHAEFPKATGSTSIKFWRSAAS